MDMYVEANIRWTIKKAREFQKNMCFYFTDCAKAFDCVDHNKLWKFFKRWKYLTCLLRNLYAGQEATVRTGHGTTDWFQIGKLPCGAPESLWMVIAATKLKDSCSLEEKL